MQKSRFHRAPRFQSFWPSSQENFCAVHTICAPRHCAVRGSKSRLYRGHSAQVALPTIARLCSRLRCARQREKSQGNAKGEVKMTSLRLLAASMLACLYSPAVFAQALAPAAPTAANPWVLGAPFPEASEEVLGATAGGKLYVFAGLAPGWKPKAMVFEYDPASNQWAKKRPMRLASHHVAF